MRFPDWLDTQPRGTLKRLERDTGVGYSTLQRLRSGETLTRYGTAKIVSLATGGAVSIAELCEDADAPKEASS